jgi:hypothetical protein
MDFIKILFEYWELFEHVKNTFSVMLASQNFPLFKALKTPNIQFSVDPMAAVVASIIHQNIG